MAGVYSKYRWRCYANALFDQVNTYGGGEKTGGQATGMLVDVSELNKNTPL